MCVQKTSPTSQHINIANQLTGFYMIQALTERYSQEDFNND